MFIVWALNARMKQIGRYQPGPNCPPERRCWLKIIPCRYKREKSGESV